MGGAGPRPPSPFMADRLIMLNAALSELGEEPLYFATEQDRAAFSVNGAFDPEDDLQARCAAIYPQVRSRLIVAYPWSWLSERRRLVAAPLRSDLNETMDGWAYRNRWHMPNPAITSIRALYDEPPSLQGGSYYQPPPRTTGWTVQGPFIFSAFAPAWAHYQGDTAEEAWPQLFENAMTTALMARLSMSLKEDLPTTRYFEQLAAQDLKDAKRVDAQSKPNPAIRTFEWEEARFISTGNRAWNVG